MRRTSTLGVVALLLLIIAGCGTSGRELRDAAPGATAPPRKAATSTTRTQVTLDPDSVVVRPTGFTLSTADWPPDGTMPTSAGCAGADVAPSLTVSGVPAGTAELLLIATEADEPTVYRWILAALPPTTLTITPDALPPGAIEVPNALGAAAWAGPCPAPGGTSQFRLDLYALRSPSGLTTASDPSSTRAALALAQQAAVLRGGYTR